MEIEGVVAGTRWKRPWRNLSNKRWRKMGDEMGEGKEGEGREGENSDHGGIKMEGDGGRKEKGKGHDGNQVGEKMEGCGVLIHPYMIKKK